jgi:hypothetical protein
MSAQGKRVRLNSTAMKMELTLSFKTSLNIYQTTRSYIPEDTSIHSHHRKDLKSHTVKTFSGPFDLWLTIYETDLT